MAFPEGITIKKARDRQSSLYSSAAKRASSGSAPQIQTQIQSQEMVALKTQLVEPHGPQPAISSLTNALNLNFKSSSPNNKTTSNYQWTIEQPLSPPSRPCCPCYPTWNDDSMDLMNPRANDP
ncbi:hypothetical protein OUZ56_021889 [Daphnia magna]|uniref:Uncharacterized protein n=1 Tax=Daphnia magna TaxID=35525 RepID=A0ABR0AUY7_9CRUS|nr:hypothetical protein OUZ56_021889 [Daphnia magna]